MRKALPGARRLWPLSSNALALQHALAWHYCDPHRAPPVGLCVSRLLPSGGFFLVFFYREKLLFSYYGRDAVVIYNNLHYFKIYDII
jgi:hypothetical protein